MLPSINQIANQSCSFEQQKMATLFGVVEKYTHNQFQLSESVPFQQAFQDYRAVDGLCWLQMRPEGTEGVLVESKGDCPNRLHSLHAKLSSNQF